MKLSSGSVYKVKIAVVGPCKSGKTVLSNFLGDQMDVSHNEYRPTSSCRIIEFENVTNAGHVQASLEVELWDCSGNRDFENCWPAFATKLDGVVLVYNPVTQDSSSIKPFYDYFVSNQGLKDSHCVLFANIFHSKTDVKDLVSPLSCNFVVTNLKNDPEAIRSSFNSLLVKIYGKLSASRESQEENILK